MDAGLKKKAPHLCYKSAFIVFFFIFLFPFFLSFFSFAVWSFAIFQISDKIKLQTLSYKNVYR